MNFHINNIIIILLSIYNIVCKELVCISFYNEEAYEKSLMELFQNLGYNSFYGPNIERDYKNPLYMNDLEILYNINNHLDKKAVDKAIELIQDWGIGSLEEKNKNLYNIIEARFKHYVKDFSNLDKVVLSDYCNDIIRGFNSKYVEKSNLINLNQKVNKGDILEKQYFKYLNDNIEVPKEKFAKRKDVLLNSLGDGTLGRVHYYNENTDNVIIDQHITIIRSDENKLPSSYIYQYLKCGAGQYHLNSLISGSTGMLMLNISHIRNLELPILPQKELFEFDNFAKDLFDKISSNTKEIEKLQKLRDTLLPKLMSGEIDVSKINCDLELKYNYMKYLFNQIHTPMSKSVV